MIHHEHQTYEQWLGQPELVLPVFHKFFASDRSFTRLGKLYFTGRKTS